MENKRSGIIKKEGRLKTINKKRYLHIRIEKDLVDKFNKLTNKLGYNKSKLIRIFIENFLKQKEGEN